MWAWHKACGLLSSRGNAISMCLDNDNYLRQLSNSSIDYSWTSRCRTGREDVQSKWLLVDPKSLGPELESLKTCFDENGRTVKLEKGKGIIWSIVTIAKLLMENGNEKQIMSPRGECDKENGNMR